MDRFTFIANFVAGATRTKEVGHSDFLGRRPIIWAAGIC